MQIARFSFGDPDFSDIPLDMLKSSDYNNKRMSDFSWDKATNSENVSHGNIEIIESDQTTHYSIVDQFGNAIAVTNTLNGAFGSKVYVKEGGFFLNNEMDDLSAKTRRAKHVWLDGSRGQCYCTRKKNAEFNDTNHS